MKVTIVCPWWKRADIVAWHVQNMRSFIQRSPKWVDINYVCIVSPGDPEKAKLMRLASKANFTVCEFQNIPIGQKLNAGINTAIELFKPDYIMNMGSDDLCCPSIWRTYRPYMEAEREFFGIDSCFIFNTYTKKAHYLDLYNNQYPVGVLRMIKTSAILGYKRLNKQGIYPMVDRGMDTASLKRLAKIGIDADVIHTEMRPFTVGLKCDTSINHYTHLEALPRAKEVPLSTLKNLLCAELTNSGKTK